MQKLRVRMRSWLGSLGPKLNQAIQKNKTAAAHAFMLQENVRLSRYQMSNELEGLASELTLSGGNAWEKLQGTVTSQLTVDFELDGKTQKLPMPALINLRTHPDENTRRRGYEAENAAWESVKETLAACLNGIKGEVNTLNRRRGRKDAVHSSLDAARIDRKTLDAMLEAMQGSFPMFRRYFQAKAKKLGKDKLAWWDISAPLGKSDKVYSFEEARDFILHNFGEFSPDLRNFAQRAFANGWIDAEPREGKRGGAFCMGVARVKESRVLCNFDGSFDQVSTIAHELGHGFHNECAYRGRQDRAATVDADDAGGDGFHDVRDDRQRGGAGDDQRPTGETGSAGGADPGGCGRGGGYLLALPVREGSLRAACAGGAFGG